VWLLCDSLALRCNTFASCGDAEMSPFEAWGSVSREALSQVTFVATEQRAESSIPGGDESVNGFESNVDRSVLGMIGGEQPVVSNWQRPTVRHFGVGVRRRPEVAFTAICSEMMPSSNDLERATEREATRRLLCGGVLGPPSDFMDVTRATLHTFLSEAPVPMASSDRGPPVTPRASSKAKSGSDSSLVASAGRLLGGAREAALTALRLEAEQLPATF
jgi:hypothetical protein